MNPRDPFAALRAAEESRTEAALRDSFPASDPPSWAGFVRVGSPASHDLPRDGDDAATAPGETGQEYR